MEALMARSTYIYIVMLNTSCSCNENHALAAFTVKHELQSYLRRRSQVPVPLLLRCGE